MSPAQSDPKLGALFLAFYECLTDPDKLETMMEMLTTWLDEGEGEILGPDLEHHSEKAYSLLGGIVEEKYRSSDALGGLQVTQFETLEAALATLSEQVPSEDIDRLRAWASADDEQSLLMRVSDVSGTELAILSRYDANGFQLKRTGPDYKTLISRFVADSFDLTHAELSLVQELLQGGTLGEIASRLGKSLETVRSQTKSLTNKLGVKSQADVLRMVAQAAPLVPHRNGDMVHAKRARAGEVELPDGRRITYEVDGGPSNKTLVYLHGMTMGRHWPEKSRSFAIENGWRLIRISRAGRAGSSVNAKTGETLLQDHVKDMLAILNAESIETASIFASADGFSIGYNFALQYPERVQAIAGVEIVPPILSRKVTAGFTGRMKTFGLACLYAPKTIKFMLGMAMRNVQKKMETHDGGVHPLIGVDLSKVEDDDGLRAIDLNFRDFMLHDAEGLWRDASFARVDWAATPPNSNVRPRTALIHARDSMVVSPGPMEEFAQRVGAQLYRVDSFLPLVSGALPEVLEALEPI